MSDPRGMRLRPRPKLLFPDDLRVGDRVMVECEVFVPSRGDYPPGTHVYVRPTRESVWQAGDQELWTWTGRLNSHPQPYIIPAP